MRADFVAPPFASEQRPHLTGRCSAPLAGHDAVIRVYGEAGNVIETHEHNGDFKEW